MDKRFEVRLDTREFKYKDRKQIEGFCVTDYDGDNEPKIIESFDNIEDARAFMSKLEGKVEYIQGSPFNFYNVEQYYIEENDYDEDGDWVSGGDLWEWTPVTTPE